MNGTVAADHYAAMCRDFRWHVPARFNIAQVCAQRWAADTRHARRVAIWHAHESGRHGSMSYGALWSAAQRLALALRALGVRPGDRVAIVMPQRVETAVANIAVYALGAISMPLSMLFGPEALAYRLQDSEAVVAIVDESAMDNVLAVRAQCPALAQVLAVGDARGRGDADLDELCARVSAAQAVAFRCKATSADDPAVLIYTSGTTGPPKGAVIPHRAMIGNLTGFVCSHNWFPRRGDVFWSPADWAWTGGLMDALLPTLYFGLPVVGYQGRFAPDTAFELMQRYRVTNAFLFPTALKAMMKAYPQPLRAQGGPFDLKLRAIMSAGEAVGDAVFNYGRERLGVTINEMFGQTEINYVVGNCAMNGRPRGGVGWPARAGSMGRGYPGHRVAVIDDDGRELPPGETGDVAVHRRDRHGHPDPVFFLGYWRNDEATRRKFTGDPDDSWCRTGDLATADADGYLWYQGRADDVFKAAGYRIGPSEVENCLVKHPAVANAAVVPKPDRERGAVVKAYVVLAPGYVPGAALVEQLQQHVRGRLAPYEYPKDIEFIDALPMTTTGKVQRRVLRLREEARYKDS